MSEISEITERSLETVRTSVAHARQGATFQRLLLDSIVVAANIRTTRGPIDEKTFTFDEFSESIKQYGVQEPILVRPTKEGTGKYELVAGERRWRASRRAGLKDIPALVKHVSDDEVFMIQVIENTHRQNLSQLQEADALSRSMERFGSLEAVARKWNRSKSWVSERLQLLKLARAAQELITDGVTADIAVINSVNRVSKLDSEAGTLLADQVRLADKKRDVARKGLLEVKCKVGKGMTRSVRFINERDRDVARLSRKLASMINPGVAKEELKRQVRATINATDKRASAAVKESLKSAHVAGLVVAKGWQLGIGDPISSLASQLDGQVAESAAGRAFVLKAFAFGAIGQPFDFETIVIS